MISNIDINQYKIRYIKKPTPIIITNIQAGEYLGSGLTIDEYHTQTECALHPALHRKILEGAVQLAIASLKPPTSK